MATTAKKKGAHWMTDEVTMLLDKVDEIKPRGSNEWEAVARAYNISRLSAEYLTGRPERDVDSCKTKFKALKNVKKPTGDPTIPPEVKRAKQIEFILHGRPPLLVLSLRLYRTWNFRANLRKPLRLTPRILMNASSLPNFSR